MAFIRNDDGTWEQIKPIKNVYPAYEEAFGLYLNVLDSVFTRAKEVNEFDFILSLLHVRGEKDPGWDSFENLHDVYDAWIRVRRKFPYSRVTNHYSLFLYGIIIEADEIYETLANLLKTIAGDGYHVDNFPKYRDRGKKRSQHPIDKASQLKKWAKRCGLDLSIYDDLIDNDFRNAIFHSNYSIYMPEIRILDPPRVYQFDQWMTLVNRALAFIEVFFHLMKFHKVEYSKTKVIEPSPGFTNLTNEKAITIIRKHDGIVGLASHFPSEPAPEGHRPFLLGNFLPYEDKMVNQGIRILPPNRIKRINRFLKFLPDRPRRILVGKISHKYLVR